jgi:hypothetical protein
MRLNTNNDMFNGVVAGFAATAVAFAAFAMPDWRLAQIVDFFGLASVLSAAQPPLGNTARLCVMLFGAVVAFGGIWTLLRAFDPPSFPADDFADLKKAVDQNEEIANRPAPRVRRADAHPDAPAPRPIFAPHEFGEPTWPAGAPEQAVEPIESGEVELEQPSSWDMPSEVGPRIFARLDALREEAAGPAAETEDEAEPEAVEVPEIAEAATAEEDEPLAVDIPEIATLSSAGELEEPGEADAEDLLELGADDRTESSDASLELAPSTGELVAKLPVGEENAGSISSLLTRLDVGLGAVEWPLPAEARKVQRSRSGERLSSMITDLQKMASRSR